jgi:hypothetical protein
MDLMCRKCHLLGSAPDNLTRFTETLPITGAAVSTVGSTLPSMD